MDNATATAAATLPVQVYHNLSSDDRTPFCGPEDRDISLSRGYRAGDPLFLAAEVEADASVSLPTILEWVFEECNVGQESELARQWRGNRCPSLSRGDVVILGEAAFAVDRWGWTPISVSFDQVKSRQERGF